MTNRAGRRDVQPDDLHVEAEQLSQPRRRRASVWLRGLIKPPAERALAYVDWKSQEVFIAAVPANPGCRTNSRSPDKPQ
jgi:hypothetical protein